MEIKYRPIKKGEIQKIVPLLMQLNTTTPESILNERVIEMESYQNYECIGAFDNDKLIGICGLWYSTRHYVGKSVEPDHVVIDDTYRNRNIGTLFFNWIYEYTQLKGCEAVELNTYTGNRKSHKFYSKEDFEIYGFHFVKIMREDKKFY